MSNHCHHHHGNLTAKNLLITIVLNVGITVSQVIGGLLSGSLALLSDAMHNFTDVLALVSVYVANRMAQRKPTEQQTFGYKRIELLAALGNGLALVVIGVWLLVEAVHKLFNPEPVESFWVIGLALLSIVLNWVSVVLVSKDAAHNSNVKSAYLHLMTDVMTSVAVLAGGLAIMFWQIYWIDPLISMLIALYLLKASWGLIQHSATTLMLFTPQEVTVQNLVDEVAKFKEIVNVHHVHLWRLDDHAMHLEAHLDFKDDLPLSHVNQVLARLEEHLRSRLGITHFVFQPEFKRLDDKSLISNICQ